MNEILIVGRRHYDFSHPKLNEILVSDFMEVENYAKQLSGYDACIYCTAVSSVGMNEVNYSKITYNTTLLFAKAVFKQNPNVVFNFVSGKSTGGTEQGEVMWARMKGKAENALMNLDLKINTISDQHC